MDTLRSLHTSLVSAVIGRIKITANKNICMKFLYLNKSVFLCKRMQIAILTAIYKRESTAVIIHQIKLMLFIMVGQQRDKQIIAEVSIQICLKQYIHCILLFD